MQHCVHSITAVDIRVVCSSMRACRCPTVTAGSGLFTRHLVRIYYADKHFEETQTKKKRTRIQWCLSMSTNSIYLVALLLGHSTLLNSFMVKFKLILLEFHPLYKVFFLVMDVFITTYSLGCTAETTSPAVQPATSLHCAPSVSSGTRNNGQHTILSHRTTLHPINT